MSRSDPAVVLAATPRGWAAGLRAHAADHGGVVVRATVLTSADALAEGGDVVVVDDITSFLTAALVRDLQQVGRSVLGVHDPEDEVGRDRLAALGVDGLVAADVGPEELVGHVRRLAVRAAEDRPAPSTDAEGTSIAGVWGSAHDADAEARRGRIVGVLGGMPVAEDWARVRPGAVVELLDQLGTARDVVVADLGRCPAPLETFDGLRHGHARAAVDRCDVLVVVSGTSPGALVRTIGTVADLPPAARARAVVVLNRAGRDRHLRQEAVGELEASTGLAVHVVESDPHVAAADWQGTRVRRGRFRTAMRPVAALVAGATARVPSSEALEVGP